MRSWSASSWMPACASEADELLIAGGRRVLGGRRIRRRRVGGRSGRIRERCLHRGWRVRRGHVGPRFVGGGCVRGGAGGHLGVLRLAVVAAARGLLVGRRRGG